MTKAILLDIEGTTTPIDFVHKTLFPYSKQQLPEFVRENFGQLGTEISQLITENACDDLYAGGLDGSSPESVSEYLKFLIESDRKSTPLKSIQGMIWRAGYESVVLKSQVFDDVPRAFERWKAAGKVIAIYSSGSVLAQKLLFKYTDHGDLTPFIFSYFDTNIGGKKDAESYRKIAAELNLEAGEILFVSDILSELDAARAGGFETALSIRDGNSEIVEDFTHRAVRSFDELE